MALLEHKSIHKQLMFPAILALVLINLPCIAFAQYMTGHAFEEAEALFRQDPRWLGADGAHSIRLDNKHLFWTFADTFISTSSAHIRHESKMVRNSIAIQTGNNPLSATLAFHWGQEAGGSPVSFFPDDGEFWYWPQASILLDEGPLIVFLYRTASTAGQGLGFETAGYALAVIENPHASPQTWVPKIIKAKSSTIDYFPATALVRDGEHVVALAVKQGGILAGAFVRYLASSLAEGNIEKPQWWTGQESGWVLEKDLEPTGPEIVLDHAGSECSIHWDQRVGSFVHITTYGFGAATIGLRTAKDLTGPWSTPIIVYRPPESDGPRPFVYGAVAQPELVSSSMDNLIITYATNSFNFEDMFTEYGSKHLYWPRVITVKVNIPH
jgi:hypothetical protein